jgi:RNA recognition motif-containing protein
MDNNLQLVIPHHQQGDTSKNVLFVSELPDNITESDLETFFQDFKDNIVVIQINRKAMESYFPKSQHATVIFKDMKRADEARRALNLRKLRGRTIRVMWHERDTNKRYGNQANLFVKNISTDVSPREFYEKFMQFGDIVSAKLCEDEDGNSLGYGYINYAEAVSAEKAIAALDEKDVWGTKLEVKKFQKKNERMNTLTVNKNLYIKNIPANFTDTDLKNLFGKFGTIAWSKVLLSKEGKPFALLAYENEDNTQKAIENLKGYKIGDQEMFVDTLMKKSDRQKILSTRITENNYRLSSLYKNCNLHVRNLPESVDEKELVEIFGKFGEIKSVKIPKYILETKVSGEKKEYLLGKGFAYVCYTDPEVAKFAMDEMNGKFIEGHEDAKRPLIIDYFMPKNERRSLISRSQQPPTRQPMPFLNPMIPGGMGMPMHPKHIKQPFVQPTFNKPPQTKYFNQPQITQPIIPKINQPDIKVLESFEDESAKKDYLGEYIFKNIENHPLAQMHNLTIDTIGKITGMILGIDDINEIFHITTDIESLTLRIQEALSLLDSHNA